MTTELRAIERTDRHRQRLDAALGIYRDTILPEAQNPERQILYWIDHSRDALGDEFKCFSMQRADKVVGYLQYSYFREEHIFFFEYLCVRERTRMGLVPSDALKAIEDHLAQNYLPGFTIVFEVAHIRRGGEWHPDTRLVAYFRRLGFRTIAFHYRYPILQSYDGEISYPADLMVRLPDSRVVVTSSELRTILRSIYFKHYLRWDRPFLDPARFAERERLINELYSQKVAEIGDIDSFGTAGDDKRSLLTRFDNRQPRIRALLRRVFGPRLPMATVVIGALAFTQGALGSSWHLVFAVPFVAAVYCLAEDTESSRKLVTAIAARLRSSPPRSL